MKHIALALFALLLPGCAHFGTPNDDLVNALIAGKPFIVDAKKYPVPPCKPGRDEYGTRWTCDGFPFDGPVTVVPMSNIGPAPCDGLAPACTIMLENKIYILQHPDTAFMLRTLFHEYNGHGSGGHHRGETHGPRRNLRTDALERERARALGLLTR